MKNSFLLGAAGILLASSALAASPAGIVFSGNDDCANAPSLSGLGTFDFDATGATDSTILSPCLNATIQDVFFEWTAPSAGNFAISTLHESVGYDTRMVILSGDCVVNTCVASNDDEGGVLHWGSKVTLTGVSAGETFLIQIGTYSAGVVPGLNTLTIEIDPCGPNFDDGFEENDDCASATPMVDGSYPGLMVTSSDKDFYTFCVGNGDTVSIDLLFDNGLGDIDGFLRAADSIECGNGNGAEELADGFSSTDDENIVWTNDTGADLEVTLEVNMFGGSCNNYDLVLTDAGNCNGYLGSMYCDANVNTTGLVSNIYGTGDIVAANNAFAILATDLPIGEFAYVVGSYGQVQVNNPGGSDGNLCVGGAPIARFLSTGGLTAGGQFTANVDLLNVPLPPTFTGSIVGGDTFNFQLWHREAGGMSNFTPGLEVTFQ